MSLWIWAVMFLVLIVSVAARLRLLEVPLERDEGEYAYIGQLILQGVPPYRLAYSVKFPGTAAAYAAIMSVFGQTSAGIHTGLLIVNGATILLVFLLGRRMMDARAGAVAAATYAVLSLSPSVLGMAAHATHFVVLPALIGVLLLLVALESRSLWALLGSGFIVGAATLMKQSGVFFAIFAVGYLVWHESRSDSWARCAARAALLAASAAAPLGVMCFALSSAGVWGKFRFWTISYASAYGSEFGLSEAIGSFRANVPLALGESWPLWALGAIGVIAACSSVNSDRTRTFVIGFSLFSFLTVWPGFYFRQHYFILLLPAIALLSGMAIRSATALLSNRAMQPILKHAPIMLFVAAVVYPIWTQREFLFRMSPEMAARRTYFANPFPEAVEVSRYIRSHSKPNDRVAVIGSEPQIYFLSGRRAATGYLYTYPLMEAQPYALQMQQEMIDEIERARPAFLVGVNVSFSWLRRADSQMLIVNWAKAYAAQHFQLVGVVDIGSSGETEYRWDDEATTYIPRSRNVLLVYRRKGLV
jgi:hypothetical protein